ncbi:MAG: cupin domain-containing protein [Streptococcus sp.]|uniref:cupin domain-containing protein n=1 Tax=Streptococcus sp. TaxID=1306 RepID=UPI00258BA265|nr:cupin domain-containing protein [Streptococcus sp.]MCR5493698.1 cupin domain-containing protein [Streptococcus sp.]
MAKSIDIRQLSEAISVEKDNGTKVNYFLYPEFEIHQNVLPANTIQDWHKHQAIEEIIVPTKGNVTIQVLEDNAVRTYTANCGEVLRVKQSIHRIIGDVKEKTEFIVFRFVPTGSDQSDKIKHDKVDCEKLVAEILKRK